MSRLSICPRLWSRSSNWLVSKSLSRVSTAATWLSIWLVASLVDPLVAVPTGVGAGVGAGFAAGVAFWPHATSKRSARPIATNTRVFFIVSPSL